MAVFAIEKPPLVVPGASLWNNAAVTATGTASGWADLSGRKNNLTNGVAPTCSANQLNGKNGMVFGGTQYFIMPSGLYSVASGDNTIFAVAKCTDNSVQRRIMQLADSGTGRCKLGYGTVAGAGNTTVSSYASNATGLIGVDCTGINNTFQIFTAFRSGTTESLQVNNGTAVTDTNATNITAISGGVGGTAAGSALIIGVICELIIYPYALTLAQRIYLARYLSNNWGIAIS